jgi:heterodisulfide reductase subunit A
VVVASCSPRLHEKTFHGGLPAGRAEPYYFQMASVREQVSWVTLDETRPPDKAKTLVAAAINRVNYHESLERARWRSTPTCWWWAAASPACRRPWTSAMPGNKVYLVEKDTTIGGHMLQFDKTFPTLDCAACIGTPKMVEVAQNAQYRIAAFLQRGDRDSGAIGNYTSPSAGNRAT